MSSSRNKRQRVDGGIYARLQRHTVAVVAATVAVVALLAIPFLTMAPTTSASTEPAGAVFDTRDLVADRFTSSVYPVGMIAEHSSGDLLQQEALLALFEAEQQLRDDPAIGSTLLKYFDNELGVDVHGVVTIADLVDLELRSSGIAGILAASASEIDAAAARIIERHGDDNPLLGLSQQSVQNGGRWIVPALQFNVLSNDEVLGFGATSVNLGSDTEPEEYNRDIQTTLRTADGWEINGIAIDVNLTSQEQGAVAGPFIGFTVLAALLIVGLAFRSYWLLAVTSVAFLMLMIWLKGITNLLGFKDDLVLSLIVPIAMVSFGVDFVFHAVGRYREEREAGNRASVAIVTGMSAVSGALLLAVFSDAAAFLSNATAGIESIVQFGLGAAIALVGADLLLGIVTPLALAWIESNVPAPAPGRRSLVARIVGSGLVASMAMTSVLFLVFVLPTVGVVLTVVTAIAALVVPVVVQRRRLLASGLDAVGDLPVHASNARFASRLGAALGGLARRPKVVFAAAAMMTAVASFFALQVPAEFDVEDFFAADTDFVEGLNQLDAHVGARSGEPATLYVEGDLTDPATLASLQARLAEMRAIDSPVLARQGAQTLFTSGVFEVFEQTWASPIMASLVEQRTGVALADANADAIPDTRQQIDALLSVAVEVGVPLDADRLLMTSDAVATAIDLGGEASFASDATAFELAIVNSRDQASVAEARTALEPFVAAISADLGDSNVGLTGSAFVREGSLAGANRALSISLPVAVLACLCVATIFLRSLRYGLVSVVPVLMVVAWLYAFMEIAGFAINLVTATIAAVSIGIGIDFALHFIARYREELDRHGNRQVAVRVAGEGTGAALVASALSSIVGFGILAFAPMPLFASYGLLTALMILMALLAALVVLPSLLVLITSDRVPAVPSNESDGVAAWA